MGCSCQPKARRCCCCRRWRSTSGPPREDWTFWRARSDAPRRRGGESEVPLLEVAPDPMERATIRRILARLRRQAAAHLEGARVDRQGSQQIAEVPVRIGRMSIESHFAKTDPTV